MMMHWTSVADVLPVKNLMVLVYVPSYSEPMRVGKYMGNGWAVVVCIGSIDDVDYDAKPTHWMPLSLLPIPPGRIT